MSLARPVRRPPSTPRPPARSLRPRKDPVQARAQATVASVLEAAAQILEQAGRAGFTTNAVAERAGVSIGSLYQYFPGKEALLIALMRREKTGFHDDATAALAAPTGHAALRHMVGAAVRQQLMRPELARLLDLEEVRPGVREEVDGASGLRGVIRTLLARNDLPPQPDLDVATDDVMTLVQGLVDAAGARGAHGDADAAALERRVLGAVLGYLGASNGPDVSS